MESSWTVPRQWRRDPVHRKTNIQWGSPIFQGFCGI